MESFPAFTLGVIGVFAAIGVAGALVTLIILSAAILMVMWRAWWLYPAWQWFLVPLGIPAITFWHFAALLLFVSAITHHGTQTQKDDDAAAKWLVWLVGPVIVWALLWWMQ